MYPRLQTMNPSKGKEQGAKKLSWEQQTLHSKPDANYKGPELHFPLDSAQVDNMGMKPISSSRCSYSCIYPFVFLASLLR